jgi:hypothetical protein
MQIMILVGKQFSAVWQDLEWGVRSGGRVFEKIYGEALFERCLRDRSLEEVFSKAMSEIDSTCTPWSLSHSCPEMPVLHRICNVQLHGKGLRRGIL